MHLLRITKFHESMHEAAIGPWRVAVGDTVAAGQPLVELITDKSVIELEAPATGVLLAKFAPEKSVVPLGYVIAAIGNSDERVPEGIAAENQRLRQELSEALQAAVPAPPRPETAPAPQPSAKPAGTAPQAAPAARQLARERGVDLAEVAAWCGKSLIHLKDVEGYLNAKRS